MILSGPYPLVLASLALATAENADLRRIEVIDMNSRYGRIFLEDWDGDSITELILIQAAYQDKECNGCQDLDLVQIYEPRENTWAIERAFVTQMGDFPVEPGEEQWDGIKPVVFDGDFNQDGTPDRIGTEPKEPEPAVVSCTVWFEQERKRLSEDYVYGPDSFGERIQWMKPFDFDGDGAMEVAALTMRAMSGCYLTVYGTTKSRWAGGNTMTAYLDLHEAFRLVDGVRAAAPEGSVPVTAVLTAVSATKNPANEYGEIFSSYRFRVTFAAAEGSVDLRPWRDYFMKHAVGYVRDPEDDSRASSEHVRDMAMSAAGEDALEFETAFLRSIEHIAPGKYMFWIECPYFGRAPDAPKWVGTLSTSAIEIEIADWSAEN